MSDSSSTPPESAESSPPAAPKLPPPAVRPIGKPTDPPRAATVESPTSLESTEERFRSQLPELRVSDLHFRPQRRTLLPLMLFLATCASTFWVGATHWNPVDPRYVHSWAAIGAAISANWQTGLQYMVAVLAILLTHEMGHFLQTVKHRIPASYPLCIPIPFTAIGTMGAVIGMDGMRADRRQIFDIGIAGPLAGLVVAVPVLWMGVKQLDLGAPVRGDEIEFYLPVVGQWMMHWAHPDQSWVARQWIPISRLNPYFMAGWVGMLITGLNMLPISQLDGGHTLYALFLHRAHTMARLFISFAIFYVVVNLDEAVLWTPMLVLVIFMGIHHPPTANDRIPLGRVRWAIGLASLAIPVLCFPLLGVRQ